MDQASLLREMMKNKKRGVKSPFAVIGSAEFQEIGVLEEVISDMERNRKEKIYRIENSKNISGKSFEEQKNKLMINIEKLVKEEEDEVRKELIRIVEKKEKMSEQIVINAGLGVDYSTINATMLVENIVFVMEGTEKDIIELGKYLKIVKQLGKKQNINVFLVKNGINRELDAEKTANTIQERVWDAFNYYIEVLAVKNEKREVEKENFEKIEKPATENKKISISLQNRFF